MFFLLLHFNRRSSDNGCSTFIIDELESISDRAEFNSDTFGNYHQSWRGSHYADTHARNKNRNIQERSPNLVFFFPCYKKILIKERIRSLWEQILSLTRNSHIEKGRK